MPGGYTGRLGFNLGKKWGTELSSIGCLPRDDELEKAEFEKRCEEFWVALENAANRLIASSELEVQRYEYDSEDAALSALGEGIMDAGQRDAREKRRKKAEKARKQGKEVEEGAAPSPVSVGRIAQRTAPDDEYPMETFVLGLLHGASLVPLSSLGKVRVLRSNPLMESSIVCNKKKCEISVKFCVAPPAEDGGGGAREEVAALDAPVNVGAIGVSRCTSMTRGYTRMALALCSVLLSFRQ